MVDFVIVDSVDQVGGFLAIVDAIGGSGPCAFLHLDTGVDEANGHVDLSVGCTALADALAGAADVPIHDAVAVVMVLGKQEEAIEQVLFVENGGEQNAVSLSFRDGGAAVDATHHAIPAVAASIVAGDGVIAPGCPRVVDVGVVEADVGGLVVGPEVGIVGGGRGSGGAHEHHGRDQDRKYTNGQSDPKPRAIIEGSSFHCFSSF